MKKSLCFMLSMLIGFFMASSVLAAGSVTLLLNGSPAPATFKGSDIQSLKAKIVLPKALKSYKFDQVSAWLTLSHLDVKGSIYYDKVDLPENWQGSTITVDLLADMKDSYGGSYGISDFTTTPTSQKLDSITASVNFKIFKKTGEKYNSYWDKTYSTWKTETIPIWNAGTVLAQSAKYTITQGKLTSASDAQGILTLAFPDDTWNGSNNEISGGTGARRQYASVYVNGKVSGRDVKFTAFTLDTTKFTEFPDLVTAIKEDLEQNFTAIDNRKPRDQLVDLGWTYFFGDSAEFKAHGGEGYSADNFKLAWNPATVAGLAGNKAIVVTTLPSVSGIYVKRPIYIVKKDPYVVVGYLSYDSNYYDENSGQMKQTSDDDAAAIERVADMIASGIKINK